MVNVVDFSHLEQYPRDLCSAVLAAFPQWLTSQLSTISQGKLSAQEIGDIVQVTTQQMTSNFISLLATDVDEQRTNPLHVLRMSTTMANQKLQQLEIAPPHRDEFEIAAMPHDTYSLGPLTWKDLGEDVHEAGITWGAWKAATVLTRRRAEGKIS